MAQDIKFAIGQPILEVDLNKFEYTFELTHEQEGGSNLSTVGLYDLVISNGQFEEVDGLETTLLLSLLTDARVDASIVESASQRRGWVGDIFTADTGRQIGSKLWRFDQGRLTQQILNGFGLEADDALAFLVEDSIARSVSTDVERIDTRQINVNILITTNQGRNQQYSILWRNTNAF